MVTVIWKKHLEYDPDGRDVVIAKIAVASASELPSPTGIPKLRLHEGSKAWDISNGDEYGMIANGTWNKQQEKDKTDWMGGI